MTLVRMHRVPAFAALLLLIACGGNGGAGTQPPQCVSGIQEVTGAPVTTAVTVGDNFFDPPSVTVAVNDVVTWTWGAINFHSVTFGTGCPTSQTVTSGTYQLKFTTTGSFNYFCKVQAHNGTVTVAP